MPSDTAPARPYLRWVGGKTQLVPTLLSLFPSGRVGRYYEPFMGGAAVYWAMQAGGRFSSAFLSDANPALVDTYVAVRDHVEALIVELARPQYINTKESYLALRASDTELLVPIERAARVVFLNKAGFNGLWRVNSKGGFNVPWGQNPKATICDASNLRACSLALQGTSIEHRDFALAVQDAGEGDLVYLDPPYVPASASANFVGYSEGGFGKADHERTAQLFRELVKRGATVLLSNSDTPETRRLYEGFESLAVNVRRSVGASATTRTKAGELIILGREGAAAPLCPVPVTTIEETEPCTLDLMNALSAQMPATTASLPGTP